MAAPVPPFVAELARLAYRVAVANLTLLASADIFDVDPDTDPSAKSTMLAALTPRHHDMLTAAENEPLLGRPTYFVRVIGGLELWPRCDKPYWFRATYRAAIKVSTAPTAPGTA
jgi:hypothetical protein